MLGYLRGPRLGAALYNAAHTYVLPVLVGIVGWWGDSRLALGVALILVAHVGFDRAMGYGLKLPQGFRHTHLGRIGRGAAPAGPAPAAARRPWRGRPARPRDRSGRDACA